MDSNRFYKFAKAAGLGMAIWYGAGWSGYDRSPTDVVRDATYIGGLNAIIQDVENTRSGFGLVGRMFTYAGLIGMTVSAIKKDKSEEKPKEKKKD